MGIKLISTGGTYDLLKKNGVNVEEVSQVTGFPEMLDGRVKTLHPNVHAGILARRDSPEHMAAIKECGIEPIDMVVINLYPFKETVLRGSDFRDIVENIDIGGPSMIRAAAKNYESVAVVTSPEQYAPVLEELKSAGELSQDMLSELMAQAFLVTAEYDAMIADRMQRRFGKGFPDSFPIPTERSWTSGTERIESERLLQGPLHRREHRIQDGAASRKGALLQQHTGYGQGLGHRYRFR